MRSQGFGRSSAITQVKVLSPEIVNVAQGQGFHVSEASIGVCVSRRVHIGVSGSEAMAGDRTAHIGTWESHAVPDGSVQRAEEARRTYGGMAVGPTHSVRWAAHGSGGFKSLWRPDEGRHIQQAGVMPRWPGSVNRVNSKRARSWKRRRRPRGGTYVHAQSGTTPGGQGVHREMESGGFAEQYRAAVKGAIPATNRSAEGGIRSSLHYGGEGVLILPPHQGVCGRHGTEDRCVTPGELVRFLSGVGISDPISRPGEVGSEAVVVSA